MKRFFLLVILFALYSCEEVVDIDLEESAPRLVVEASLLWNLESRENVQIIRLSTTTSFFKEEVPPATGAEVLVTTSTGVQYNFEEVIPGVYRNEHLPPLINEVYELRIIYNGEHYTATEQLIPAPPLEYIEQDVGGFDGDEYEFRVYYRDPLNEKNFYLFRYINENISLQIYDDEFTDGNLTFAFFNDEDARPGDLIGFEIQGLSRRFYEYMYILRSQSGSAGGPFQTQPGVVRGNVVNITNPENFPFGYFRLSEINFLVYEVE